MNPQWPLQTPGEALQLLTRLGATPWLVQHHRLVVEAAEELSVRVSGSYDRRLVLLGAALHDAGKIVCPAEMSGPGHAHEAAGRDLLISAGVSESVARFCVTHAAWGEPGVALEDLLVAAADKLWKGKREAALEARLVQVLAEANRREPWEMFEALDPIFETIAAGGDERLQRFAGVTSGNLAAMEHVIGVGGIFFKAKDPDKLKAWYRDCLGLRIDEHGQTTFPTEGVPGASMVWMPFPADTKHFAPSTASFMINFRVKDLHAMLAQLRAAGATVDEKVVDEPYGKFGWVLDPEGNRIELWEVPAEGT